MKVRVEFTNDSSLSRVWIDGEEVSNRATSCSVKLVAGDRPAFRIELFKHNDKGGPYVNKERTGAAKEIISFSEGNPAYTEELL